MDTRQKIVEINYGVSIVKLLDILLSLVLKFPKITIRIIFLAIYVVKMVTQLTSITLFKIVKFVNGKGIQLKIALN